MMLVEKALVVIGRVLHRQHRRRTGFQPVGQSPQYALRSGSALRVRGAPDARSGERNRLEACPTAVLAR